MRRAAGAVLRFARYLASAVLVVLALFGALLSGCLLLLAYVTWPGVAWRFVPGLVKCEADKPAADAPGAVATPEPQYRCLICNAPMTLDESYLPLNCERGWWCVRCYEIAREKYFGLSSGRVN